MKRCTLYVSMTSFSLLQLYPVIQMYHLPLLPGYGPNANIRSSVPAPVTQGASYRTALSEAEEDGYQGTYFPQPIHRSSVDMGDGFISSISPVLTRNNLAAAVSPPSESGPSSFASDAPAKRPSPAHLSDSEPWTDNELQPESAHRWRTEQKNNLPPVTPPPLPDPPTSTQPAEDDIIEAVFFEYGVVVFFGLTEGQERDILEDIENAGIMKRKIYEDDWEVEECHFTVRAFLSASRFVLYSYVFGLAHSMTRTFHIHGSTTIFSVRVCAHPFPSLYHVPF